MRWSVVVTVLSIACLTTASTYLNLEVGPRSYIPSRDIELQFLARNLDAPLHDLLRRTVTNSERILKPNSSGNIPKKVSQSTPTEQQTEPIPPTSRSQKNKLDAPSSRNLLDKACKAAPKQSNKAEDAAARDDQSSPLRKSNVKMGPNQALSVQKGLNTVKTSNVNDKIRSLSDKQPVKDAQPSRPSKKLCRRGDRDCEMEDLSRPSQIAAATPPISGIQQQPIPLELARTPSRRMIPAGVQEMSRYPAADPLPNIAIGLSSVAAGADNSAATVGCCAGKVFGAACATATACGLGVVGASFAAAAGSVAVAAHRRNYQMTEMQAQNTRTATAAHHATQQSQHATQQSAETQPVIKQVASQASIHGQVLPKIASQPNLDEITTPLLSGASSASASSSQT